MTARLPASDGGVLAWILGGLPPDEFLASRWGRAPLHARGAAAGIRLLDSAELERRLRGAGALERCRVVLRRADVPEVTPASSVSQVSEGLSRGFALHVGEVEEILDGDHPICVLASAVGDWLGAPLRGVSVFLAPPGAQGIPLHHDDEDVFTVQLEGEKRWIVHPWRPPRSPLVQDGDPGAPVMDVTLGPGDALYVPRGMPHRVLSLASHSLSVGLAFRLPDWGELLGEVLAAAARQDPALAGSVPPLPLRPAAAPDLEAARRAMAQALAGVDGAAVEESMARVSAGRRRAPPPSTATFLGAMAADSVGEGTVLRRKAGHLLTLERHGSRAYLGHGGGPPVSAPLKAVEALEWVLSAGGPFTPAQMGQRLDLEGRVALARRLVRLGILEVVGAAAASAPP